VGAPTGGSSASCGGYFGTNLNFGSPLILAHFSGLAEELVGSAATLIYPAAFMKPARVGSRVAFHRDQAQWDHSYPSALTVWVPLDRCTPENGCLEVVPWSHQLGALEARLTAEYPFHPSVSLSEYSLHSVPVPMNAGDALLWHPQLLHGSGENHADVDRAAFVMVFADSSRHDFVAKDAFRLGTAPRPQLDPARRDQQPESKQ
jgi:phytanoyl-CoA hydroxylase